MSVVSPLVGWIITGITILFLVASALYSRRAGYRRQRNQTSAVGEVVEGLVAINESLQQPPELKPAPQPAFDAAGRWTLRASFGKAVSLFGHHHVPQSTH